MLYGPSKVSCKLSFFITIGILHTAGIIRFRGFNIFELFILLLIRFNFYFKISKYYCAFANFSIENTPYGIKLCLFKTKNLKLQQRHLYNHNVFIIIFSFHLLFLQFPFFTGYIQNSKW